MIRIAMVAAFLGGCELNATPADDPRCPKSWHFDPQTDGTCSPPDGYTALLFAEFGGSGIYGFARLTEPCSGNCEPTMIRQLAVEMYLPADVTNHVIRTGAVAVAKGMTSSSGVYKMRVDPGTYEIACVDPFDGLLVTGGAEVKANAIALYAIDLDHSHP